MKIFPLTTPERPGASRCYSGDNGRRRLSLRRIPTFERWFWDHGKDVQTGRTIPCSPQRSDRSAWVSRRDQGTTTASSRPERKIAAAGRGGQARQHQVPSRDGGASQGTRQSPEILESPRQTCWPGHSGT